MRLGWAKREEAFTGTSVTVREGLHSIVVNDRRDHRAAPDAAHSSVGRYTPYLPGLDAENSGKYCRYSNPDY